MKSTRCHSCKVMLSLLLALSLISVPVSQIASGDETWNPETPENWELLINARQGYSLEYPKGSIATLFWPEGVLHVKLDALTDSFTVEVIENPDGLSAEEWVSGKLSENETIKSDSSEPPMHVLDSGPIDVPQVSAYGFSVDAFDHVLKNVVLVKEDRLYLIVYPVNSESAESENQRHSLIYDRMLSSFRVGEFATDKGFTLTRIGPSVEIPNLTVPMFAQNDPRWSCDQLGTCTQTSNSVCPSQPTWKTIGSHGCAVTSASMVYKYYESLSTAPQFINICLRNYSGYANGCDIYWNNSCKPGSVTYVDTNSSRIDDDLTTGRPVIADVGGHFVVIVGKRSDGQYNVNDPWNGVSNIKSPSQIRGVRRYTGPVPNPPNNRPNTPILTSPNDGFVSTNGQAPTLTWYGSDPDNDPLEYYVEVRNLAGTLNYNSGWITNTWWRESRLDYVAGTYEWRVKARDLRGAQSLESFWTLWRRFTIQVNYPPSISFDTANGQMIPPTTTPPTPLWSRVQDWTFAGTASDPEGLLNRVEFWCPGNRVPGACTCENYVCDNVGSGPSQTSSASWLLARSGMSGENCIYFKAYDDRQSSASRCLDLKIDLEPPYTSISHSGVSLPGSNWYNTSVTVFLSSFDGATGHARSGVSRIHYRQDGGAWQAIDFSLLTLNFSADGEHCVEWYAEDRVGNEESPHSTCFQIDKTPPSQVSGVTETHGVINNQWQREQNVPTFTWGASTDPLSGVWGYELCFGPNGETCRTFLANEPREWTPQPAGVSTGTYYLRARARDVAGNWSNWTAVFTYRYDGTPPDNPSNVAHTTPGVANDTWQRITNVPDFTWPVPHDEGSGIQGYYTYWGTDPNGTANDFTTANSYSGAPLCGANETCTGYLRLRSKDNVENLATEWSTGFTLKYDNQPPVADFMINNGITQTNQTSIILNLLAHDGIGSGVEAMRLSHDGVNWPEEWEDYPDGADPERQWTIPAISRRFWPVYLQVRDLVGLESEVISRTIYFDVNPVQPRSLSYRLFDHTMSAGVGLHGSPGYQGQSTVGQVVDSANASSSNYFLAGGYQAGSQALPLIRPIEHDEYTMINSVFASGTGANTLTSPGFSLVGVVGEPGLPNNQATISSQSHQLQPGFLAAAPSPPAPPELPPSGPPPPPPPEALCDYASLAINGATAFTNDPNVTLSLCAPFATEMMISNDASRAMASWEPFAESKAWTIQTVGPQVQPRFVYVAYKDPDGTIQTTYFDNIIYDPNPPTGQVVVGEPGLVALTEADAELAGQAAWLVSPSVDGTIDLYFIASDDNSGLAEVQIGSSPAFTDTVWQPYSSVVPWAPPGGDGIKTVYARFKDNAGNISPTSEATFQWDTMAPEGSVALSPEVVGSETMTATVYLVADDNLSGVEGMRVSEDSSFTYAPWLPYDLTFTWPISLTGQTEIALYAQYRDVAGNVSQVYSDTFHVDTAAPLLYVEVEPGSTVTRTVTIQAYDGMYGAGVTTLRLTNDPFFLDGVVTMPFTSTVQWVFDERDVIWVMAKDAVGNWSEPYPAWAGPDLSCDIGGDGQIVSVLDIQAIAQRWLQALGLPYDRNGDGVVNIVDIMWFASRWGASCE